MPQRPKPAQPPKLPQGGASWLEAQGAIVDQWFGGFKTPQNQAYVGSRTLTQPPHKFPGPPGHDDPTDPNFACQTEGTKDPYFDYIQNNIRANNP